MSGRASRIIRRARSAARRWGLPFDRALPVVEVALGALLGLVCGAVAWAAVTAWFLDQSAEQALEVSAAGGRDAEAAAAVAAEVAGAGFQKAWRDQDASAAGLGGACRLRAEAVQGTLREDVRHRVLLRCAGRSGRALRQALYGAGRRLLELDGRLELRPPGYDEKRGRLVDEKARLERESARLDAEQAAIDSDRATGTPDPRPAVEAVAARREARERAARRLAAREAEERQLTARRAALQAELAALGGTGAPDADELRRLEAEKADLERRLQGVRREDCTDEHPVIRRLGEIARRLRHADYVGELDGVRGKLAEIDGLRAEVEETRRAEAAACSGPPEGGRSAGAGDRSAAVLGNRERQAINDSRKAAVDEELRALDSAPLTRIAIRPAGPLFLNPPRGRAVLLLLAAALGAGLALLFHLKVAPGFTLIDDREDLAEKLQVPVLGVVPRLAALERR